MTLALQPDDAEKNTHATSDELRQVATAYADIAKKHHCPECFYTPALQAVDYTNTNPLIALELIHCARQGIASWSQWLAIAKRPLSQTFYEQLARIDTQLHDYQQRM